MAANLTDNFSLTKAAPIDNRTSIESISNVSQIAYPYVGLIFHCKDTNTHYKVTSTEVVKQGPFSKLQVSSYAPLTATAITEDFTAFEVTADEVGQEERFAILTVAECEKSNVTIDWGDGSKVIISEDSNNYVSDGNRYVYKAQHTYSTNGTYIIKIFGNDYYAISREKKYTYPEDNEETTRGLLSRCFEKDLPVASCVRNLDYFAAYSSRLINVNVSDDFGMFQSSKFVFKSCKNLQKVENANKLSTIDIKGMFYNCHSLTYTDLKLPSNGVYDALEQVFANCYLLELDINEFIPLNGFANGKRSLKQSFLNCEKITGTIDDKLFWNNINVEWDAEEAFTGTNLLAPVNFGGNLNEQYNFQYKGQFNPITKTVEVEGNHKEIVNPRLCSKIFFKGTGLVNIETEEFYVGDSFEFIYDSSSISVNFSEEWINYNNDSVNVEKGYKNFVVEKIGQDENNYQIYCYLKQNKDFSINSDRIEVDKVDEKNNIIIESNNLPIAVKTNKGNIYPIERGTISENIVEETIVSTKLVEDEKGQLQEVQEEKIIEVRKFFIDIDHYLIYDNAEDFEGVWTVFIASGVQGNKGKDAITFAQPVVTTLASDKQATATSVIENGVVTLNLGIPQGIQGENAISVSENVEVTTLNYGKNATANVEFENGVASFSFGIPQGAKGENAITFAQPVVTTLKSGEQATATSSIEEGIVTLELGIPQGEKGENALNVFNKPEVTTLNHNEEATAEVSFNNGEVNFEFGIPKGKPAGFGEVSAAVSETLEPEEEANVTLTTDGTDEAKIFRFDFKIPRGKDAFSFNQKVEVETLNYNDNAYAETTISDDNEVTLKLGIPQAQLYSTEIDDNGYWVVNGVKTEHLAQVMGSNVVYASNIPENPVEGTVFIQADKNEDEKYLNVTKLVVVNDEPEGEIANGTILI